MTPMMSSSRITRTSSPFSFTSVPEYLPNSTRVADLDVERADIAVVDDLAVAGGDDLALDRLLGGGVRQDDATGGSGFLFLAANDHAVVQRGRMFHGTGERQRPRGGSPGDVLALVLSGC
jgi:hypothetical protein